MKLTERQVRTVIAALVSAELNEEEFFDCHIHYGKSIDRKVTEKTKAFIKRMRTLQSKMRAWLNEQKGE